MGVNYVESLVTRETALDINFIKMSPQNLRRVRHVASDGQLIDDSATVKITNPRKWDPYTVLHWSLFLELTKYSGISMYLFVWSEIMFLQTSNLKLGDSKNHILIHEGSEATCGCTFLHIIHDMCPCDLFTRRLQGYVSVLNVWRQLKHHPDGI